MLDRGGSETQEGTMFRPSREDDAVILGLEPLDAVLLDQLVAKSNFGAAQLSALDTAARATKVDEKVHAVDSCAWIVLDTEVDVLSDTKAEAAVLAKVTLTKLVLFDLQPLFDDFHGLLATHCHVASDLLVTSNTEGPDRPYEAR